MDAVLAAERRGGLILQIRGPTERFGPQALASLPVARSRLGTSEALLCGIDGQRVSDLVRRSSAHDGG